MVLAQALVDQETDSGEIYDPSTGHNLPSLPLHKARQVGAFPFPANLTAITSTVPQPY